MSNELIPSEDFHINNILINSSAKQTEIPSENGITTIRSIDPNDDSNINIVEDFQQVDNIVISNINSCFTGELPTIPNITDLLKHLCELMIRFDTSPKNYQKSDFEHFIKTISNSLIYLYTNEDENTSYTGTDSASFIGIAILETNPHSDKYSLNNKFPGIYFAQTAGYYAGFDLNVTNTDLFNNIVLFIPKIENGVFINYNKSIYNLNIKNNTYQYSSDIKRDRWEISHNLGRIPSVIITDTAGTVFEGSVTHTDNNNLIITFSAPFKGYADLN